MDTAIWDVIERLAARFEAESPVPVEQGRLLQLLKIQEEAGEVAQAAIGASGTNPRKGFSHSWDDVEAEVCDVAVTALVALARRNPAAREVFASHMKRIAERDLPAQRG